jgi:hypothetical protein
MLQCVVVVKSKVSVQICLNFNVSSMSSFYSVASNKYKLQVLYLLLLYVDVTSCFQVLQVIAFFIQETIVGVR